MHAPLPFLISTRCADPLRCCPNPTSYKRSLLQPLRGCTRCKMMTACPRPTDVCGSWFAFSGLAIFPSFLCAGDEKLRRWVPAPPTCGLSVYPLRAYEELLVTRSHKEASFSGNPGTAATFHLKSPASPTCCRL